MSYLDGVYMYTKYIIYELRMIHVIHVYTKKKKNRIEVKFPISLSNAFLLFS